MLLPLLALLGAGLVADGSLRVEARGGTSVAGQDPSAGSFSADLRSALLGPDGALRLDIAPTAVLAQGSQVFVRGAIEGELRLGQTSILRLRQRGGYGAVDLSPVSAAAQVAGADPATAAPRLPPGSGFALLQESRTAAEVDSALSQRLRISGSAAWTVSGGADAAARAAMPLSRGPQGRATLEWAATRLDLLRAQLAALETRYSNGRSAAMASLTGEWRTTLSRSADFSLSGGPAIGRISDEGQPVRTVPYAVGAADLRLAVGRDVRTSAGVSAEPLGDPLTGELVERASAHVSAGWEPSGRPSVTLRLSGSVAVTGGSGGPDSAEKGDRFLQAELSARLPVSAHSALSVGARGAALSRPLPGQPARQWVAFVGYVVELPQLR
jgi:hypothetical protein